MTTELVTIDHYTDRSRTQRRQRCPRARWLEYHEAGTGIVAKRTGMHLAVGAAFHVGAAALLLGQNEAVAVAEALAEFDTLTVGGLDAGNEGPVEVGAAQVAPNAEGDAGASQGADGTPTTSAPAFGAPVQGLGDSPFAGMDELGLSAEYQRCPRARWLEYHEAGTGIVAKHMDELGLSAELMARLHQPQPDGGRVFEDFLRDEQRALVEGLVRAWARRGLPRLLEQYEVLEVEREGQWVLGEWISPEDHTDRNMTPPDEWQQHRLWWMSRHDGLLLDKQSGQLVIQSFKTTGALDGRKLRDAQRDMQGLSEAVEVEQRLGWWWQLLHLDVEEEASHSAEIDNASTEMSQYMIDWLSALPSPPRIDAIRYEYVLKGERWEDKELTARCGFKAKSNRTPLLQCWVPAVGGGVVTASDIADSAKHSFKWTNELGESKSLYYKNWKKAQVWDAMGIAQWVDSLDAGVIQPEARQPGELERAQDVLGDVCPPPVIVFRQDDDLRDWMEQVEAQERTVVRDVALVREAAEIGEAEKRSVLNSCFPQNRQSCSYPGECEFAPVCYGGADIRRDPLGSGRYKARTPNHPVEGTKV